MCGLWKNVKFPLPNYGGEILCGVFERTKKIPSVVREEKFYVSFTVYVHSLFAYSLIPKLLGRPSRNYFVV